MDPARAHLSELDNVLSHWIHVVGNGIEVFGVLVVVIGIGWSTLLFVRRQMAEGHYETYKIRIGRSLLLGLEVLVAADIVKTIALDLTFMSLGLLAGLVVVRTFLSWTLVLEIEGRWPWQREPAGAALGARRPDQQGNARRHDADRTAERETLLAH
jgi:uncharacterized membrane protein